MPVMCFQSLFSFWILRLQDLSVVYSLPVRRDKISCLFLRFCLLLSCLSLSAIALFLPFGVFLLGTSPIGSFVRGVFLSSNYSFFFSPPYPHRRVSMVDFPGSPSAKGFCPLHPFIFSFCVSTFSLSYLDLHRFWLFSLAVLLIPPLEFSGKDSLISK